MLPEKPGVHVFVRVFMCALGRTAEERSRLGIAVAAVCLRDRRHRLPRSLLRHRSIGVQNPGVGVARAHILVISGGYRASPS